MTAGEYVWTVERGTAGTAAAAQKGGAAVLVDRVQQNLAYTYDKASNVTSYVNDLPPDIPSLFGGKVTHTYTYDGHYRLTSSRGIWEQALNTRFHDYDVTYDASTGNTTSKHQRVWEQKVGCKKNCVDVLEDNSYDFTDVTFQGDHQHQLLTQGGERFSHDLDGNITSISSADNLREMTWDAQDKLTMVIDRPNGSGGKPTFYTYDHLGEVAKEDKEQGRSWFVNQWVTVENGTTWKNYFADGQRLGVKFSQDGLEQKQYFLHTDLLGSTNIATDRAASVFQHQEYLPTGEPWVSEDSTVFRTPYQYSGEYTDEDHGLVDFGQRWFEPRGGFFLSADPLLYADPGMLVTEPAYQATYALAQGNAVSYVDLDGWDRGKPTAKKKPGKAIKTKTRGPSLISKTKPENKSSETKVHDSAGNLLGYIINITPMESWDANQMANAKEKIQYLKDAATEATKNGLGGLRRAKVNRTTVAANVWKAAGKGDPAPGKDIDHKVELQFGGADSVTNMWELDSSVNRSFGSQLKASLNRLKGKKGAYIVGFHLNQQ